MRFDSLGMFWQDAPTTKGRRERVLGPMPTIPETGWQPPTDFPNLSAAKVIGVDTETWDPDLRSAGPGWGRGKGHIVGVSLAVPGKSWYFPIRHETQAELNMDAQQVLRYVGHVLGDARPKVGANLIYDLGWLQWEGVDTGTGRFYDIQFAEALLNSETPDVSLDSLAERYLGVGKVTDILYAWLASWLGGKPGPDQRKHMAQAPITLAGPYAEADAALPIAILEKQWEPMAARGVLDLFDMECRLIPLLVKMRLKGAPVDLEKAHRVYDEFGDRMQVVEDKLKHIAGQPVNPNAGASIKSAFVRHGIPIPTRFDKQKQVTKESFSADLLDLVGHPIPDLIVEHRKLAKVRNTFIKSYIIDKNVNGRVHCTFHPLKSDDGGARSGRFSSSDPNLQNIPVRTEEGQRVRDVFTAEGLWRKWDYSQIEYRLLAHHAVGEGSEELRRTFTNNPDVDYHELVGELVLRLTGIELPRRNIKTINFGLIYGMSQPELQKRLGLGRSEAAGLFQNYHKAAPFVKATMEAAENEAHRFGYVQTLLGRKSDFLLWGPERFEPGAPGLEYNAALLRWGQVKRAFTHKAVNRKLQGGAADIMKKAMVDCYEAGLFEEDACGMPLLTVHDELDFDDKGDPERKAWKEFKHTMENCVPTRVPVVIESSKGKTWGSAD